MKTNMTKGNLSAAGASFSNDRARELDLPIGDTEYPGGMYGEPDENGFGDVDLMGSGDLSPEEVAQIAAGAPAPAAVARAAKATPAQAAALGLPNQAMASAIIPAMWGRNAKIRQFASERGISGALLHSNLQLARTSTIMTSQFKSVRGAGITQVTEVTFDSASLPAATPLFYVPMIFVSISNSQINARSGGRYEIWMTGRNQVGQAFSSERWIIERTDNTKAMEFALIPFVRVKDDVKPMIAAYGHVNGSDQTLVLSVLGSGDDDVIQATCPGTDSTDYVAFAKGWRLTI